MRFIVLISSNFDENIEGVKLSPSKQFLIIVLRVYKTETTRHAGIASS